MIQNDQICFHVHHKVHFKHLKNVLKMQTFCSKDLLACKLSQTQLKL